MWQSALKMNEAFVRSDSRALQAGDHRFDPGHVHQSFNHLHRCRLAAFFHSRRFFDWFFFTAMSIILIGRAASSGSVALDYFYGGAMTWGRSNLAVAG
jgi:hypothetical protein